MQPLPALPVVEPSPAPQTPQPSPVSAAPTPAPTEAAATPAPVARATLEPTPVPPPAPAIAAAAAGGGIALMPVTIEPVRLQGAAVGDFIGEVQRASAASFGDALDATLAIDLDR